MARDPSVVSMDPSQQSAGLQAVLAYWKSKGVAADKVTPDMIRQAVASNARAPGDEEANRVGLSADLGLGPVIPGLRNAGIEDASPMPQRGGGVGGRTSAAPTSTTPAPSITPNVRPDVIAPEGDAAAIDPASGSSLMQTLAPLLAGAGAASFPLGAYILDKIRGGAGAPGQLALPAPEGRLALPDSIPPAQIEGPVAPSQVAGPRVGAAQLPAPGEAPAIPLPNQSTGRPPIPLQDVNVPRPALETAGVQLNPAMQPLPQTPAGDAVTKAVGKDAPAPRAKAKPRAKARLRLP